MDLYVLRNIPHKFSSRWECSEVMLCDFFNGVELLSADYLSAWMEGSGAPSPSRSIQTISDPAGPKTQPGNPLSLGRSFRGPGIPAIREKPASISISRSLSHSTIPPLRHR